MKDEGRRINGPCLFIHHPSAFILAFQQGYNVAVGHMEYKVLVHESEEGFSISCPGLPGCWSQGVTEDEALANIQDAIREYLAAIDDVIKGQDVREVRVAV